ncbi:phytochrome A-associated F-box protein-like [Impatiens glandulifera]|uniref:phytochrome A-associated F-box protein-like n=1 Tax=Impatiens glandulifera TaxID=253017 RepID=UPI001FB088C3|nr:phytochrome A-associated F-box protein-like [Impatiens glandulifera]
MVTTFLNLPDDVIVKIFLNLGDDARHWANLSCVCTKFPPLIRDFCWKERCIRSLPGIFSDLFNNSRSISPPPGGWAALYKLAISCPGVYHSGVVTNHDLQIQQDLDHEEEEEEEVKPTETQVLIEKKICCSPPATHIASGFPSFSREEGSKMLGSRFRDDYFYICHWPGCVHEERKKKYMLFRGIFVNFKESEIWRKINEVNKDQVDIPCGFCSCKKTWDLQSSFCLRRVFFGHHANGEPIVRAYVCDNGHVSGAWTEFVWYR